MAALTHASRTHATVTYVASPHLPPGLTASQVLHAAWLEWDKWTAAVRIRGCDPGFFELTGMLEGAQALSVQRRWRAVLQGTWHQEACLAGVLTGGA